MPLHVSHFISTTDSKNPSLSRRKTMRVVSRPGEKALWRLLLTGLHACHIAFLCVLFRGSYPHGLAAESFRFWRVYRWMSCAVCLSPLSSGGSLELLI